MVLPTLNFLLYTHGNASQSQELASRLLDSLSEHGFVKLVGHGISDEKIDEMFKWVSRSSWGEEHVSRTALGNGLKSRELVVKLNIHRTSRFSPWRNSTSWPSLTLVVQSRREASRASERRVAPGFTGKASSKLSLRKISRTRG